MHDIVTRDKGEQVSLFVYIYSICVKDTQEDGISWRYDTVCTTVVSYLCTL